MKYIKNIYLFIGWLWWNVIWYITPTPTNLHKYLKKVTKTYWPWFKFKPCIYRNDVGNMYEVWLRNDLHYSKRVTITIMADIEFNKEGKICGIDLFDEELLKIEKQHAKSSV